MSLSFPLTPQVPYINIVMIGEAGSGKSSFLRTFTTALANTTNIKDTYRVSPLESRETVATKKVKKNTIHVKFKVTQSMANSTCKVCVFEKSLIIRIK